MPDFVLTPKKTPTHHLARELFPGRLFKDLTREEVSLYHLEWKRRRGPQPPPNYTEEQIKRRRADLAIYRAKNRDRLRAYQSEWFKNNRHRTPAYYKKYRLKKEFGLSMDQYLDMMARQDGKCALCGRGHGGRKIWGATLCVDHDHISNRVRALLCHQCNMVLGHGRDDPALLRRAADYLEHHARK